MRDLYLLIRSEAKRRPAVQALLDRAYDLTDEEIETVDVPMKWYRDGLRLARMRARIDRMQVDIGLATINETTPEQSGMVFEIVTDGELRQDRGDGRTFSAQVDLGEPILVLDNGTGWHRFSLIPRVTPDMMKLMAPRGRMTRAEYLQVYEDYLAAKYPDAPIMKIDAPQSAGGAPVNPAMANLAMMGVSFR